VLEFLASDILPVRFVASHYLETIISVFPPIRWTKSFWVVIGNRRCWGNGVSAIRPLANITENRAIQEKM